LHFDILFLISNEHLIFIRGEWAKFVHCRLLQIKNNSIIKIKKVQKMRKEIALKKIEKEIEKLPSDEQLKLIENLIHRIRKTKRGTKKELDWNKLYGLGKGLWNGEDAQEYVNRLREERI